MNKVNTDLHNLLSADFDLIQTLDEDALLATLAIQIEHLIQTDFSRLLHILYRADVDQERIKEQLNKVRGEDAALVIAQLYLERQKAKIHTRQQYGNAH